MTALFGTMNVHVAVVEFGDDLDPELFATNSEAELDKLIRNYIESVFRQYADDIGGERGTTRTFVLGEGAEIADYSEWYEVIHEMTTVPWVTRNVIPVEIV